MYLSPHLRSGGIQTHADTNTSIFDGGMEIDFPEQQHNALYYVYKEARGENMQDSQ